MILKNHRFLCGLAILLFVAGCMGRDMILERDFIMNFKIEPICEGQTTYLRISGLCGHSAYGIRKISFKKDDGTLYIHIILEPGCNGNFDEKIKIDHDVSNVVIGNDASVIWTRR